MKTKGKTLKTQTNVTAITNAPTSTISDYLDRALKDITSPGDQSYLQNEVWAVRDDLGKIVQLKDSVSNHLRNIHVRGGETVFNNLATNVFPRMGLSRPSAYRLLSGAVQIAEVVSDPHIRGMLLGRTEKNFTRTISKGPNKGKVELHPAFVKAIAAADKALPNLNPKDPEKVAQYCTVALSEFQKLGKAPKKSDSAKQKEQRERIVDYFTQFLDKWGIQPAAKLQAELESILTERENTIEADEPEKAVSKTA